MFLIRLHGKRVCLDEPLTNFASLVFIRTKFGRGEGDTHKLLVGGIFLICYSRKHSVSS